jgi:hypothetical protein
MRRRLDADCAPLLSENWTLGDLRAHWDAIVGPELAAASTPGDVGRFEPLDLGWMGIDVHEWDAADRLVEALCTAILPRSIEGVLPQIIIIGRAPDPDSCRSSDCAREES